MTDAVNVKPTLGTAIHAISGKWGWFVALGVGELILGGIASANLMAANLASVLVIGAAMVVAGIFQIIHAFTARGLRGFLFWQLAGIVYAAAGAIILYDPVFASLTLSLTVGVFMVAAGVMRIWAGFHARPMTGWRWIVAAGVLSFCVGVVIVALWPAIGLWLLGAMLVVDLIFQGWGLIAFGVGLKARASRHSDAA
ncbi:HdeD family acid-resistance protein [Bradyrhizobium lablabi]|uniref:HdeD family acid-resistance protein n=1 Tax=Bradyrhizobium lablabi TaxID=722472 RepID=UPI001BADBFE4|nr:HdeD family acid-resistance protein [Bradyrhizobium lablabi]MBR1119908.1 HdeD family acid-resistance protein [Bradyrhizobium lablabi]